MQGIIIAFMTGLTTGGLSCLAVQGGLLASALANQWEKEVQNLPVKKKKGHTGRQIAQKQQTTQKQQNAMPILMFLLAKLVAYTILGFFLGLLGSIFQLTPLMRAILMLAIGIFMVGNALRMFNVHPIFRYFNIEPPAALKRYLRKTSKNDTTYLTPIFLGALTVLIPCGVTQAMMAVVVGTGNAVQGAVTMFAFTLGTSVVFFVVSYLSTQIGARMEVVFMRFVAVVILVLGMVSIDSGLNLIGSPVSISRLVRELTQPQQTIQVTTPSTSGALILSVLNNGYSPQTIHAKANEPITLQLVTNNTQSCSRAFVIPSLGIQQLLPATGTVPINIPPQRAGTVMGFTCSMGMFTGQIVFDQ
jgi:sulfite exporter TauE/SafE